jgi:hypothetical protein
MARANWGNVTSDAQMQDWLIGERVLLLAYMEYWRRRAETPTTREAIRTHTGALEAVWNTWRPFTDPETGDIFDAGERERMLADMSLAYAPLRTLYLDATIDPNEARLNYAWAIGYYAGMYMYCYTVLT